MYPGIISMDNTYNVYFIRLILNYLLLTLKFINTISRLIGFKCLCLKLLERRLAKPFPPLYSPLLALNPKKYLYG